MPEGGPGPGPGWGPRGPRGPYRGFNGYSPAGGNWNRRSWYGRTPGFDSAPDVDINVKFFPRLRTLVKFSIDKEHSKLWAKYVPEMEAYGVTPEQARRAGAFKLQRAKNVLKGTALGVVRYVKEPFLNIADDVYLYNKQCAFENNEISEVDYNKAKLERQKINLERSFKWGIINSETYHSKLTELEEQLQVSQSSLSHGKK